MHNNRTQPSFIENSYVVFYISAYSAFDQENISWIFPESVKLPATSYHFCIVGHHFLVMYVCVDSWGAKGDMDVLEYVTESNFQECNDISAKNHALLGGMHNPLPCAYILHFFTSFLALSFFHPSKL